MYRTSGELLVLDAEWLANNVGIGASFDELGDAIEQSLLNDLIKLQQLNREGLEGQANDAGEGFLDREIAAATLKILDMLAAASPYLTGTLQSAHRGESYRDEGWIVGYLHIDPYVENPIYPGRPIVYGERLVNDGKYANWFEFIGDTYGGQLLEAVGEKWIAAYDALWRL